ncbi:MAG: flagellar motor switch protein FliG [Rhizobiaceae bacterium]|nr:flagellar motor switch protein FliG [Rhizobiaceae bacterium]
MNAMNLSRPQKAAAILVAMGKPSAGKLLRFFKQDELKTLIESARLLKTIPQSELEVIVAEFEDEFTEGAGQLDSADQMDDLLNETLTPDQVKAIMGKEQNSGTQAPPVWTEIEKLDPPRLGAFLATEHPQTSAVVLSKIGPQMAANTLLALDKPLRSEIVRRMISIASIPETATKILEGQLRARLLGDAGSRDTSAGQIRVASLLNELDKSQLDEVMQDLQDAGTPNLEGVKSRLFSFEDIMLLSQKGRVTLFDGLSSELVTMCLHKADAAMVEAVLSSIGARSRRMIEAELGQGSDSVPMAEIIKARKSVAATVIRLAREGAIEMPTQEAA